MEGNTLTATPVHVFRIGARRVVACRIVGENPNHFLGKEFCLYSEGQPQARIKIEGLSTAGPSEQDTYDFSYSGDEIRAEQIGGDALIRWERDVRERFSA